jgi:hypothetical protein
MLEREREELTVTRRRRGTGGSGDHSEVLPAAMEYLTASRTLQR